MDNPKPKEILLSEEAAEINNLKAVEVVLQALSNALDPLVPLIAKRDNPFSMAIGQCANGLRLTYQQQLADARRDCMFLEIQAALGADNQNETIAALYEIIVHQKSVNQ